MRAPPVDAIGCSLQGSGMTLVATAHRPLLPILLALSGAHFLNDLISSMIPATYPLLKEAYRLDFVQVGLITLAFQLTASLLQPLLGLLTDHRPWPYAMVAGMAASLSGLLGLASAAGALDVAMGRGRAVAVAAAALTIDVACRLGGARRLAATLRARNVASGTRVALDLAIAACAIEVARCALLTFHVAVAAVAAL